MYTGSDWGTCCAILLRRGVRGVDGFDTTVFVLIFPPNHKQSQVNRGLALAVVGCVGFH